VHDPTEEDEDEDDSGDSKEVLSSPGVTQELSKDVVGR
jgi:hypothetical protein